MLMKIEGISYIKKSGCLMNGLTLFPYLLFSKRGTASIKHKDTHHNTCQG